MPHFPPPPPAIVRPADPELQASLARLGLAALSSLLGYVPAGEALESAEIGALVRLIDQAAGQGGAA